MQSKTSALRRLFAAAMCLLAIEAVAGVEEDFERAGRAHRQGDYRTSVTVWTALADHGQVDAQYNLGLIHLYGDGVERDYAKALQWFKRAAEQGDRHAQFELGGMYQRGEGVAADAEQAHHWFTAHLGHPLHHSETAQMQAWRRDARELLWARDMRESLAAGPQAASEVIAALRRRADTVAQAQATSPDMTASADKRRSSF